MNEMQIFENEVFGTIRAVVLDSDPWFVGIDVARALGYKDPKGTIRSRVDDDDKKILKGDDMSPLKGDDSSPLNEEGTDGNGFDIPNRGLTIINEPAVYSLTFSSKLPAAKQFKGWVTHDILPTLRRSGYVSLLPDEDLISADRPEAQQL